MNRAHQIGCPMFHERGDGPCTCSAKREAKCPGCLSKDARILALENRLSKILSVAVGGE